MKKTEFWKPLESLFNKLYRTFHGTNRTKGKSELEVKGAFYILLRNRYLDLKKMLREKEDELFKLAQVEKTDIILIPEYEGKIYIPEELIFEVDNFELEDMNYFDFKKLKKGE